MISCDSLHFGTRVGRSPASKLLMAAALALGTAGASFAQAPPVDDLNEPGVLEPVSSHIQKREIRVPNTDQSTDGDVQSNTDPVNTWVIESALGAASVLGQTITHVASPNDDMRLALQSMLNAAQAGDAATLRAHAQDLMSILLGTTEGRIYDGFSMLNYNRWKDARVGAEHFPPDAIPGEYKMKEARDTGRTFISPFDGAERKIWEADVNMLYYDGQIDSDTFLLRFPLGHHPDDVLHVNYRIYSMVREDFSPTLVMLDRREDPSTVQFPFKGFDSVWIAFEPGEVLNVTVKYPPIRMIRGVYDWGWRVHPPRIQFLQPVYEITNAHTGETQLDPQGVSFAFRNREDLTLEAISDVAPEMKMYKVAMEALNGASPATIEAYMTVDGQGPAGTWVEWASLAKEQRQLPREAWDVMAADGLTPGDFGDYQMVTVYMNNEMYGEGPFLNEIRGWNQSQLFHIKLINLDKHTHYFRNVDFGARLHDDILRCCGGGETSFEIMNFKGTYGIPKVAEMQWRAGWGFRPHFDLIQQKQLFSRGSDRIQLKPFTGGEGGVFYGYQFKNRIGDFRFNPPPFIIGESAANPSSDLLRDLDGQPGLLLGQITEGTGIEQMCPGDPFPGFCTTDIAQYNPNGALNFPPPPLRGQPVMEVDKGKFPGDIYPNEAVELRFPPFLRNPAQGIHGAGDIIPPTSAWRPFLWINPNNGTLFLDPDDPGKGYWVDLTFSHGAPVFAGGTLSANVELPRASAQVFYQFDDLFHDNSIFSPHPLFEGADARDSIASASASLRGSSLRVSGTVTPLVSGELAGWVTVHDGGAGADGCTGEALGFTAVAEKTGRFVFRKDIDGLGSTLCVQSVIGGFLEVHVR